MSSDDDDERYRELLEELRTIIPGAEVLLAFLLTVPFASGFSDVDLLGKRVFAVSLVSAAISTLLFLAPAAHHRVANGAHRRRRLRDGRIIVLSGMALLPSAISAAVFVVIRQLFGSDALAVAACALILVIAVAAWYVLPGRGDSSDDGATPA
jgi:hypothetical protein